jgi:uncharacterized RDD family membrane protein YckC
MAGDPPSPEDPSDNLPEQSEEDVDPQEHIRRWIEGEHLRTPPFPHDYEPAGYLSRVAAFLIDGIFSGYFLWAWIWAIGQVEGPWFSLGFATGPVWISLYFVLFPGLAGGQTPGKWLFRIKVINDDPPFRMTVGDAFLRWVFQGGALILLAAATPRLVEGLDLGAAAVYAAVMGLGAMAALSLNFLWPLWSRHHRALHDMVVGTLVVRRG